MIISHKYRFIFIKTNKTAGTSIEIALSRFCGDKDVITPIVPEDEEIRGRLGYRGPQNYLASILDYRWQDLTRFVRKGKRKLRFYNHISAKEARGKIGENVWNSYFKFCFERNPFERVISLYYWRHKKEPRPTLSEYLASDDLARLIKRGVELYSIDGEIAVDRVCIYENMEEELEEIRVRLGIQEKIELPMAKASFRKDKRSYREILTGEQMEKIRELFNQELSLFGYE
jgi:hypothetical protein